jgi:putative ABC transport system permease protein
MSYLGSFFRNLWHKQSQEKELDGEISSYLDLLTEEKMAAGMDREQARRAARIELGGVEQVKEQVREVRAGAWVEVLAQDLRYGFRMLVHNPGFSALVVLTLALGIGANTAIFSMVYGVLLRPLPYAHGGQLVVLHQQATHARLADVPFSVKELFDYREFNHSLDALVEYHSMPFLLVGDASAERVQTGVVSANFFEVLGIKPLLGRTFLPSDDTPNADPVLVMSYKYWQRQGGDPNMAGKTFRMNDKPHTVIGVLPPFPQYPAENDIYAPTVQCPFRSSAAAIENRKARLLTVFGRLKPGVSLQTARADLSTVANQISTSYPEFYPGSYGYAAAMAPLQDELTQRARTTLLVLLSAAGFVLLIACANVANLLLARLLKRERELAVRVALGASRTRLIRQLLTETVMLSLFGGALGLALASPILALLIKFAERFTARAAEVRIDGTVLMFTFIVSVGTGILFGLVPALCSGVQVSDALKQAGTQTTSSRGRQRLRAALVMMQIAVSFMLLIGAGLTLRSFLRLQRVDPGFNADRVLTMVFTPDFVHYAKPEQLRELSDNILGRVRAVGGVESASLATSFPYNPVGLTSGPGNIAFQIEGRPVSNGELEPMVDPTYVSSGYFETIRQPLLRGRTFTDHDGPEDLRVGIVNQVMARHRWPGEDPIGKRVTFDAGRTWTTVVGIVGDAREYGLERTPSDEFYTPTAQSGIGLNLVVRTLADPDAIAPLIRSALHGVDPYIAVDRVNTLERLRSDSVASPRVTTILLGIFAALALVISASGIVGIMALSVSQRTRELGIRMALGQPKSSVVAMVVQQGLVIAVAGTAMGLLGALALGRLLSSLLFETSPTDVTTFAAVSFLFLAVTAFSCFVPARRATLIDPFTALRQE